MYASHPSGSELDRTDILVSAFQPIVRPSPVGASFALKKLDGSLVLWHPFDGSVVPLESEATDIRIAWSGDGRLATAGFGVPLRIWTDAGDLLDEVPIEMGVTSLTWTHNEEWLISGLNDGTLLSHYAPRRSAAEVLDLARAATHLRACPSSDPRVVSVVPFPVVAPDREVVEGLCERH